MTKPDKKLIAEVILYSQGFQTSRHLSEIVVPFIESCESGMSKQGHYDFGLRALKSILTVSGRIMRESSSYDRGTLLPISSSETDILLNALHETLSPRLVKSDIPILKEFVLIRGELLTVIV